jgi:hypothetical protein
VMECWSDGVLGIIQTEVYKPCVRQRTDMMMHSVNEIEHK